MTVLSVGTLIGVLRILSAPCPEARKERIDGGSTSRNNIATGTRRENSSRFVISRLGVRNVLAPKNS